MDISIRSMPISVQPWSINPAIGGMEQNNAERSIMPEAGEPSAQGHGRDERNAHTETGRISEKKQNRGEKASPSKSERPVEKAKTVKEIRQPVKGR